MKRLVVLMVLGVGILSCTSTQQYATDCAPKREKHRNKMQRIPMDTVKQENRPKYD